MAEDGGRQRSRIKPQAQRQPLTHYYRGAAKGDSPFEKKLPRRSLRTKVAKILDWLVLLLVIFCLIYSLLVRPDPKVIANSNVYQPSHISQAAAAADLKNLNDRTKLTFDENKAVAALKQKFPEISAADIELPIFGQKPVIHLQIAQPDMIFVSGGKSYVLATSGVLVSSDTSMPAARDLPTVEDQSGFTARIGKAALSSSQVAFINQIVSQCRHADVPIKSLILPAAAQELDLRTTDKPYYVKFYLGGDPLLQTGQFLAARHQFATSHKDPAQYLDVRVSGKIFYK